MTLTAKQRAYQHEYYLKNAERKKAAQRRYRKANAAKIKAGAAKRYRARRAERLKAAAEYRARPRTAEMRWRRLGMPVPTRQAPETCECCARSSDRKLNLDHDHGTGKFRGWLCWKCNAAIGKLGDTAHGVALALAYLERNT